MIVLIDRSFSSLLSGDSDAADPLDRRGHQRIPLEVDVRLGGCERPFGAVSANVSLGGVGLWAYRPLACGARISVRLRLPTASVAAVCVVRWSEDGQPGRLARMGLQFVCIDAADLGALVRFCGSRPRLLSYEEVLGMLRRH